MLSDLHEDSSVMHGSTSSIESVVSGAYAEGRQKDDRVYCKRKRPNAKEVRVKIESDDNNYEDSNQIELRNAKEYNKTIDLPTDDTDSHQIEDLPTILNGIHTRNRLKSANPYCKRKLSESKEVIVKIETDDDDDNEDANQIALPPDDSEPHQIELRTSNESDKGINLPNVEDVTTPSAKQQENVTSKESKNDTIVELKVGEKVLRINTNISQWIEKHKNQFLIKKSTRRTTLPTTVTIQLSKHTMTDFAITPAYDTLPPEDRNLKAFFDSMLRATQRLPTFHQRRIKCDLVKALCNQGVDVYSCFVKFAATLR